MIYRMKEDHSLFLTPGIGPGELREALGQDEQVTRVLKQPGTNESVLSAWHPLRFSMVDVFGKQAVKPDIVVWRSWLIMNQAAFSALEPSLVPFGEFLPAFADGEAVTIFNCLTFAKEDQNQTIKNYIDGIPCGLESLAFDAGDTADKLVFKSRLLDGLPLFCTSDFRRLLEDNQLRGIAFDTDLLSSF